MGLIGEITKILLKKKVKYKKFQLTIIFYSINSCLIITWSYWNRIRFGESQKFQRTYTPFKTRIDYILKIYIAQKHIKPTRKACTLPPPKPSTRPPSIFPSYPPTSTHTALYPSAAAASSPSRAHSPASLSASSSRACARARRRCIAAALTGPDSSSDSHVTSAAAPRQASNYRFLSSSPASMYVCVCVWCSRYRVVSFHRSSAVVYIEDTRRRCAAGF